MPIDAPAVLDSTVADMDAAPHRRHALLDLPLVDYSGMEANLAHKEHAFGWAMFCPSDFEAGQVLS